MIDLEARVVPIQDDDAAAREFFEGLGSEFAYPGATVDNMTVIVYPEGYGDVDNGHQPFNRAIGALTLGVRPGEGEIVVASVAIHECNISNEALIVLGECVLELGGVLTGKKPGSQDEKRLFRTLVTEAGIQGFPID